MKKAEIIELFRQFEQASCEIEGIECWSARELYPILGYTQWRNFVNVIDKAKEACLQSGQPLTDHFAGVSKMVQIGSGAEKQIDDVLLTARRRRCKESRTPSQERAKASPDK